MKRSRWALIFFAFLSINVNAEVGTAVKKCIAYLANAKSQPGPSVSPTARRTRLGVMPLEERYNPDAPAAPFFVSASLVSATTATISWQEDYGDPTTDIDDPTGTEVYVDGTFVADVSAGTGSATAFDLPEDTTVTITVYSYNDDGYSSGSSTTLTTGSTTTIPDAPSGVFALASDQDATVSWGAVADADFYNVYLNGSRFTSSTNSIYFYNLTPETVYQVYVTAENSAGESDSSETYSFLTDAAPVTSPPPPTPVPPAPTPLPPAPVVQAPTTPVLTPIQITTNRLRLQISGGIGADYFVLQKKDENGIYRSVDFAIAELVFEVDGLSEFTNYDFKVIAQNSQYSVEANYTFRTDYQRFLNLNASPHVIVATVPGSGSLIQVFDSETRQVVGRIDPFPNYNGNVYVATGDYNGDGVVDIVAGAGMGGGPRVRLYDGSTGQSVADFFPYESAFRGGVQVALGDVNGDGYDDLITGTGPGGGPRVRVIDIHHANTVLADFFAYEADFRGGVQVAAGVVDGGKQASIFVGTGEGGGPRVRVFKISNGQVATQSDFFAYESGFRGGVYVAAGDLNGDGRADVIAGTGVGGGPRVVGRSVDQSVNLTTFFAAPSSSRAGIVAAYTKVAGKPAIVSAEGKGGAAKVSVFSVDGDRLFDLDLGLTGLNGVYVGGN